MIFIPDDQVDGQSVNSPIGVSLHELPNEVEPRLIPNPHACADAFCVRTDAGLRLTAECADSPALDAARVVIAGLDAAADAGANRAAGDVAEGGGEILCIRIESKLFGAAPRCFSGDRSAKDA